MVRPWRFEHRAAMRAAETSRPAPFAEGRLGVLAPDFRR
jgi:hypothetical protein